MTQDEIIRMAKECGVHEYGPLTRNWSFELSQFERFAALVREQTLKDDKDLLTAYLVGFNAGAEREWVDLTREDMQQLAKDTLGQCNQDVYNAVIAAFKEKNK